MLRTALIFRGFSPHNGAQQKKAQAEQAAKAKEISELFSAQWSAAPVPYSYIYEP